MKKHTHIRNITHFKRRGEGEGRQIERVGRKEKGVGDRRKGEGERREGRSKEMMRKN